MKVVVIDDEESLTERLRRSLTRKEHEVEVFYSLKDAREGLEGTEEPMVVLLDHDFGGAGEQDQKGYDLCGWLRETHPFGLLLPIIYLTGRELPDRFLQQQRRDPFVHPTAYLSKDQLASEQDLLPNLLKRYEGQFERIRELFEKQSAQQALIAFRDMEPEDFDTYEVE